MKYLTVSLIFLCACAGLFAAQDVAEPDSQDAPMLQELLAQAKEHDTVVLLPKEVSEVERKKALSSGLFRKKPFTGKILFEDEHTGEPRLFSLKDGKRHGAQWTFFPDGQARHLTSFSEGRIDGPQKSWFWYDRSASGNEAPLNYLARSGQWEEGRQVGIWKRWDFLGSLYSQIQYEEGKEVENGMKEDTLNQWRDYYSGHWKEFFDTWRIHSQPADLDASQTMPAVQEAYKVYDLWRSIDRVEAPKVRALAGAGTIDPKYSIVQDSITLIVIEKIDYTVFDSAQIPVDSDKKTVYEISDFHPAYLEEEPILYADRQFTSLLERYAEALLEPKKPQAQSVLEIERNPEDVKREITTEEKLKAEANAKKKAAEELERYQTEKKRRIQERREELNQILAPWVAHRLDDDGRFSVIYNAIKVIVFNKTLDEAVLFTRVRFVEPSPTVFLKKDTDGNWQLYGAALPGVSSQIERPAADEPGILSLFTDL